MYALGTTNSSVMVKNLNQVRSRHVYIIIRNIYVGIHTLI